MTDIFVNTIPKYYDKYFAKTKRKLRINAKNYTLGKLPLPANVII
jgi:hypothetical protein